MKFSKTYVNIPVSYTHLSPTFLAGTFCGTESKIFRQ